MLEALTPQEFAEWRLWYRIEKPDRLDFYFQQVLAAIYNAGFKAPGGRPFKPADFAPDLRTPEERQRHELGRIEHEAQVIKMRERGAKVLEQQRRGGEGTG